MSPLFVTRAIAVLKSFYHFLITAVSILHRYEINIVSISKNNSVSALIHYFKTYDYIRQYVLATYRYQNDGDWYIDSILISYWCTIVDIIDLKALPKWYWIHVEKNDHIFDTSALVILLIHDTHYSTYCCQS